MQLSALINTFLGEPIKQDVVIEIVLHVSIIMEELKFHLVKFQFLISTD